MKQKPTREEILSVLTTVNSTSKIFGVSGPTFKKWLIEYNIIPLTHQEASASANFLRKGIKSSRLDFAHSHLENKEWLIDQWITKGKSKEEISKLLKCSPVVVNRYIQEHNISNLKNTKSLLKSIC